MKRRSIDFYVIKIGFDFSYSYSHYQRHDWSYRYSLILNVMIGRIFIIIKPLLVSYEKITIAILYTILAENRTSRCLISVFSNYAAIERLKSGSFHYLFLFIRLELHLLYIYAHWFYRYVTYSCQKLNWIMKDHWKIIR